MKKKLQQGFAVVETVLVLIIVGLVAFVVWYAFTSKSNTDNTLSNASNSQTPAKITPKKSTTANTTTTSQIVITKSSSGAGQYLADTNGAALYTYGADTSGVSNCTGSCLTDWPIYNAASAPSTLPANVTVITRSDGSKQYAYKGMPLYTFTGDQSGQVTGNGVSNFHVAKP